MILVRITLDFKQLVVMNLHRTEPFMFYIELYMLFGPECHLNYPSEYRDEQLLLLFHQVQYCKKFEWGKKSIQKEFLSMTSLLKIYKSIPKNTQIESSCSILYEIT